jgi:cephalosporin-C deacetylase
MPLVDLPVEQLRTWQGRNPRPEDVDDFWDNGIDEMQRLDPQIVLQPASFKTPGVECFDLWFSGLGGARIHAKYLRPAGAHACPALLRYHGYTANSGDWSDHLAWAANGWCVAAMDCRGQGGLSEDLGAVYGNTHKGHIIRGLDSGLPSKLLFRAIFLDAAQLVRVVQSRPEVDARRVGTFGMSQGGALALVAAALEPSVARCATGYPFLCDYLRVWEMDLAENAYAELREYFRSFDPLHERHQQVFTRLGYIDVQFLAHRIRAKTLMGTGLMDRVCPPSSQFAAFNRITADKDVAIFPDFGHERLPGFQDRVFRFLNEIR